MKKNYRSAGRSRKIRTNNLKIFNARFSTMDVPVAELVANGVDAALANKTDKNKMVDVAFETSDGIDYIVVKNTGKPIRDFEAMLDLGREDDEEQDIDCTTNHLRGVGFKAAVGYFSKKRKNFIIETRRRDGWHKVTGPYDDFVNFEILDTREYLYGDHFVTRIAIPIETPTSEEEKLAAKEFLRRKFSVVLMKEKTLKIFFEGEEISYVIHGENARGHNGSIVDDKKEILARLYVGVSNADDLRNKVRFVKQGGFTFAEVDCPLINGVIHVLSMEAEKQYQGTNIMGVSVFHMGTLVEYSCGDVISKMSRRSTNRMNNFKGMPNNRNEFSVLATYVDLIPGDGYMPKYSDDKKHVFWNRDEKTRALRVFIDDLVGGYYREFVHVYYDLASREKADKFIEGLSSDGNHAYIREGVIWEDGFKGRANDCARIDGVLIPKTPKNIERINAYKNAAYGTGRRTVYKLTRDDFDLSVITPREEAMTENWAYDFKVVEYKSIKNPRLTADDIACAEKYVKFLACTFGLDRKRITVALVGIVDESNYEFNKYLDISKEDGIRITIVESYDEQ